MFQEKIANVLQCFQLATMAREWPWVKRTDLPVSRACVHEDGLIGNFSGKRKQLDFYIIKRIGYTREGPGHRYERTGMTTLKDCGK